MEFDAGVLRDQILATAVSIGGSLSKDGSRHLQRIIKSLEGPQMTEDDFYNALDETQRLVMFGGKHVAGADDFS